MSKRKIGEQRMTEILGDNALNVLKRFEEISPDFAQILSEHAYGDVYARPLLSDKIKEVAAVASIMGQGKGGFPLKSHLMGLLNVGFTEAEVLELILFLTIYNGYPMSVEALQCAKDVFERKKNVS